MRRCLHAFLVGVLTLSMSMDTARACWYLRRSCHRSVHHAVVCPPVTVVYAVPAVNWSAAPCGYEEVPCGYEVVSAIPCDPCAGEIVASDVTVGAEAVMEHVVEGAIVEGAIVEGAIEGMGEASAEVVARPAPVATGARPAAESVSAAVEPAAEPTLAAEPTPAGGDVTLPDLQPAGDAVQPASALAEAAAPAAEEPATPMPLEGVEPAAVESAEEPMVEEPGEVPADPGSEVTDGEAPAEPTAPEEPAVPETPAIPETEPEMPAEPSEPNLFEENEGEPAAGAIPADADMTAPEGTEAEEPMTDPEPFGGELTPEPFEPAADDGGAPAAGDEPMEEPVSPAEDAPLSDDEPAAESAPEAVPAAEPTDGADPLSEEAAPDDAPAAPANSLDAAARRSGEPVRRWIDHSGSYAVVGVLVAVRADGRCVIDAGHRTIAVPLEALSSHDRDYAERAGARMTARRGGPPAAGDTAGL